MAMMYNPDIQNIFALRAGMGAPVASPGMPNRPTVGMQRPGAPAMPNMGMQPPRMGGPMFAGMIPMQASQQPPQVAMGNPTPQMQPMTNIFARRMM